MPVNESARVEKEESLSEPIAFRVRQSHRDMLDAFMKEDGHETLTPLLREICGFYIYSRLRGGRKAVRVDSPA
jgi:hypothetical protein